MVEEDQKNKRNKTEQQILVPTTSLTFDISHNISLFKRGAVYYISVKRVEEEFQTRAAPFFRLHVGESNEIFSVNASLYRMFVSLQFFGKLASLFGF